jgi:hypothetical protein
LRSVKHEELITHAAEATDLGGKAPAPGPELAESEIGAVFGIELDTQSTATTAAPVDSVPSKPARKPRKPTARKRNPTKARPS